MQCENCGGTVSRMMDPVRTVGIIGIHNEKGSMV